jgi:UDP-2,3-diacylglucosamine pyrophosphatase LpxH
VLGNVEIRREAVHETADGRRFLVLHGDELDSIVRASPLLESLGSRAYGAALNLNRYVNAARRRLGYPYWSVAAFLKHKVKNAVKYIANFERALAEDFQGRLSLLRWTETVEVLVGSRALPLLDGAVALDPAA